MDDPNMTETRIVGLHCSDGGVPKLGVSVADGRGVPVSQKVHPGWSRVYARVLTGGTRHVGDAIVSGCETSTNGVRAR